MGVGRPRGAWSRWRGGPPRTTAWQGPIQRTAALSGTAPWRCHPQSRRQVGLHGSFGAVPVCPVWFRACPPRPPSAPSAGPTLSETASVPRSHLPQEASASQRRFVRCGPARAPRPTGYPPANPGMSATGQREPPGPTQPGPACLKFREISHFRIRPRTVLPSSSAGAVHR